MHFLDRIAEQKIAEAAEQGALDDLPGAGHPLALDDDPLIPEDLRMAYRILKNAGLVPPEVSTLREIGQLEALLHREPAQSDVQSRALRRLELLRMQLEMTASGRAAALFRDRYRERLLERLGHVEAGDAHSLGRSHDKDPEIR